MIPRWTLVERTANRAGKGWEQQPTELCWTCSSWNSCGNEQRHLQEPSWVQICCKDRIKGQILVSKSTCHRDWCGDFRQGICCWFQCRAGPWLGGCSDDSSDRNCWRWHSNISVTHSCVTDFLQNSLLQEFSYSCVQRTLLLEMFAKLFKLCWCHLSP